MTNKKLVATYLTEAEKKALSKAAKAEDRTVSNYVALLIREKLNQLASKKSK